jgi:hypothetical protein
MEVPIRAGAWTHVCGSSPVNYIGDGVTKDSLVVFAREALGAGGLLAGHS